MVRNRKRKTDIGLHTENNMRAAIQLVEEGMSLRKAGDIKNVNYSTLCRYVKKKKSCQGEDAENMRLTPNYSVRKVFQPNQEAKLKEYLITCAKMSYGLDTIETRKLAYELAKYKNLPIPGSWESHKMAGLDWLYGFRKRNPDLTLRKPEPCSLSRATSFNRHNVGLFFDNLENVIKRSPSFGDGTRLYALDETGTTTVQKPKKVIAAKGSKQLNKVTSGERGTLVTTCCIVSASGSVLPPAMVFPRKNFKHFMLNKAPPGALGLAQPTGWMNNQLFPEVIRHFVRVTGASKDNPCLLIYDYHESHLAPEALNVAKDSGVTLLTIPPHTSHKLQPLDVSVFGPLQTYYNAAADSWMMRNPGVPISIYNIGEILGLAFEKAMTPANIKSGFLKTGIFPYDRNIFSDDDYMPSEVTNRHNPAEPSTSGMSYMPSEVTNRPIQAEPSTSGINLTLGMSNDRTVDSNPLSNAEPRPVTSGRQEELRTMDPTILKSPIECRDYPKAKPRVGSTRGRKRGKTIIATDTPVKQEIEQQAKLKENKKNKVKSKVVKTTQEKIEKVSKMLFIDSIEDSEDSDATNCSTASSISSTDIPLTSHSTPKPNDFVVVRFNTDKQVKYFIGQILTDLDDKTNEYDISYLRKSHKSDGFCFPLEPDMAVVAKDDIEIILKPLIGQTKTKRQTNIFHFPKNLLKIYRLT